MLTVQQRAEMVAQVAHEQNRAYCRVFLDDSNHLAWGDAPEWVRSSAVIGVLNLINNPKTTPRQSHESWLQTKVDDGWVYGPVKDAEKKTHPCCVPYDELPEGDRLKDELFCSTVRILLGLKA